MSNSHKKQPTKESTKEQKQPQTELDETAAIGDNQNSVPLKKLNLQETEEDDNMKQKSKKLLIVFSLIAIAAGTATGVGTFKIYHQSQAETGAGAGGQRGQQLQQVADDAVKKGDVFGVQDEQVFKDSAEGYLEKGGLDGEGSHKLLRPGGSSQTVYLTSSVTDLDKLVGMQVKVWGETFKGQKAGWLMDVGKVEVLDPQAQPPQGEQL
jgi:hypothetical protein